MLARTNNLKIVVLECPYDTWNVPPTQEIFGKMVSMKIGGYQQRHPYGVLPVDTTDFISTHILICEGPGNDLKVLTGYKMISLERCRIHNVQFPMAAIFDAAKAPIHKAAALAIIEDCEANKIPLLYTGSWTFHSSIIGNREFVRELHPVFEAMYYFAFKDCGFKQIMCGCVPSMRTNTLFEKWGHYRVQKDGEQLPPVSVPHLQGDQVVLMHLREFSDSVIQNAEKWRSLWQNRTVVSAESSRAQVIPFKRAA